MSGSTDLKTIEKNIDFLRDNLLDMSLRNNLLNFKSLKRSIEVSNENLIDLFDILVLQEKSMEFLANKHIEDFLFVDNIMELHSDNQIHIDLNLQTNYDSNDLKKRLSYLYNQNKLSLEEQGYNTLFLALGFLNWSEIDYSDKINKAPLILIPIQISRSSISAPYKIKWNGEEIKYNLSLQYKLQEQGVDLPKFEEFDGKEDLYNYFKEVEKQISNFSDWTISMESYLSKFSFKKHIMFEDLNIDNWQNIDNNSIKNLFVVTDDVNFNGDNENTCFNTISSSFDYYNVLDADFSQLEVLNEIKKGKNLVVEGPPGTGKSQTIVNIIAELLAHDKKVLFVSEKKAALDVVKSRLDSIGLGEACLELHGKNSNKKEVLKELKRTLELDSFKVKDYQSFQNLDEIKEELNDYVELNHLDYKGTELNPYELIGMLEFHLQKLEKNGKIIDISMDNLSNVDKQERGENINNLKKIFSVYELIRPVSKSPWNNTSSANLSTKEINELENKFRDLYNSITTFNDINNNIYNLAGFKSNNLNINLLINNSKSINPNIKLFKNNDKKELDELINDLSLFQSKTKGMNLDILDMDFESIDQISEFNNTMDNLNVNYKILEDIDLYSTESNFKNYKESIDNSNLKPLLNNEINQKLDLFKELNKSFVKRNLGRKYKKLKEEFSSYYDYDVSTDVIINDLENLIKLNSQLSDLRKKISNYYNVAKDDEAILIDINVLKDWIDDLDFIKAELKEYKLNVSSFNRKYGSKDLKKLKEYKDKLNNSEIGKYYFGELWNGHKSNLEELKSFLRNLKDFNELYDDDYFNTKTLECIKNKDIVELNNLINQLSDENKNILELHDFINNKLKFNSESKLNNIESFDVDDLKEKVKEYLNHIDYLKDYGLFEKNCIKYTNNLTEKLIEKIRKDEINSEEMLISLFYYNFSNNLLELIYKDFPELNDFNYKIHENKIKEFKKLDIDSLQLNKYRVKEILSNKRPNINIQIAPNSSLGILKKEMSKKRRIMPIRKLLSKTKEVISSIKPCFMMSPLSIAQFLTPEHFESYFDYIIFDEASQVKVEDAIGAMFRGKNYVVMGDTKQLPPTTFFETELEIDEEDENNYTQDLESILHLCKNTFNTKMLKWHYRSRHESLIAVSNQEFYNNKLYVFPSPIKNSEDLGLKFIYNPNTIYDRGNARNNIKEAEDIINYAINCVKKYDGKKSIGIGTFSTSQRNTIEDILEKKLEEDPSLEKYFNTKGKDEFFIKNLENIQGDERDIILISMGYGKDLNGKLYMNFGPLNGTGGERRLNVLITRAKEQCVIFSNFKSSDIHITEKTSLGIKALKTFLYYAEKREFPDNYITGEDFDSDFERSVYNFLTDEGYLVEKQVGCAGYKIDLAIVDKEDADQYILAIECDGATYHSSVFARDRDRLRQQVLENLGWKFHRIWSTDWYHSRRKAKQRLLDAINKSIVNKENIKLVEEYESNIENSIVCDSNDNTQFDEYFQEYTFCNLNTFEDFETNINNLIKFEGPIHIEEIYDRLKILYDKRATKAFKNQINNVLFELSIQEKIINKDKFYYPLGKNNIEKVRIREKPNIKYISDDEIDLAIVNTLKLQFETDRDDLIKSVSQNLGFKKLFEKIKNKINIRIDNLIASKKLIENLNIIDLKR